MKEYRADCCVGSCATVLESDDGSLSYQKRKHVPEHCESAYEAMERIVFLDHDTYYYRKRKDSITTSAFSLKQLDCVKNSKENIEFVRKNNPDLISAAEYKYIKTMLWCYVNLRKLKTSEAKRARGRMRSAIRRNRVQALKNPHLVIYALSDLLIH